MKPVRKNHLLKKYKIIESQDWVYNSHDGTYSTELVIIEDRIIFENAYGKPNLFDTKAALKIVKKIVQEKFKNQKPHYVSDSRNIKGADGEVRKYVAEFHRGNTIFESVSLIATPFTKALFSIAKNLGVSDLQNWNLYRNENYCIDEILEGEIIIGEKQSSTEYDLIYKTLADISSNEFSYESLINNTNSNQELNSILQAIQIINHENDGNTAGAVNSLNRESGIMFKSVLENTESIVALMNQDLQLIKTNSNFKDFFESEPIKDSKFGDFVTLDDKYSNELENEKHTSCTIKHNNRSLLCKLYKVEHQEETHIIFIGEDI